uniref:C2H2-type domain-containing protein n=1 Tax=Strigamia maritima TaxID=126957 RepID=T1IPM6_STRMM
MVAMLADKGLKMAIRPPDFTCVFPLNYHIPRLTSAGPRQSCPPPPPPPPPLPPVPGAFSHGVIPPYMPRPFKRETQIPVKKRKYCEYVETQIKPTVFLNEMQVPDATVVNKLVVHSKSLVVTNYCEEELRVPCELMQPLYCKLCGTQLNGSLQASSHYEGKNHKKKEKQYIEKLKKDQGIPIHPINGKIEKEKKELKEEDLYCKLCDVAFNSDVQARQHYSGRNHIRRIQGEGPCSKGFFNQTTGKWQRQLPPAPINPPKKGQTKTKQKFICTVCNTTMTSQLQLDSHLVGTKHKSKIAVQERQMEGFRGPWTTSYNTATG